MKHLGLFEGIGGFSLAARWMGWETVAWVEINDFCQKVLKKNFPEAKGYGDIKEFDGTQYRGTVDIVTGGFPCQPYSTAGKRKGKEDSRHLWPEMLRVIREVQPMYVVGENVRGLTNWNKGLVFDEVQADLEVEGYEVLPFLLPACGVNAPHRRDRIWFVAYSKTFRERSGQPRSNTECREQLERAEQRRNYYDNDESRLVTNSYDILHEGKLDDGRNQCETRGSQSKDESERQASDWKRIRVKSAALSERRIVADSDSDERCERRMHEAGSETTERYTRTFDTRNGWRTWEDFPTQPPVCRRDDGIPNRMDRIKSLGNAIVPQIAFEIFKAIEAINETVL